MSELQMNCYGIDTKEYEQNGSLILIRGEELYKNAEKPDIELWKKSARSVSDTFNVKYAIRVAKDNDGEINILRTITVPTQTPLSAGTAFTQPAARAFEPLERAIEKEGILNLYLVRISNQVTQDPWAHVILFYWS